MLIPARKWIRETFVQGSRPPLKTVEKWIERGNLAGKWDKGTLLVDPQSMKSDHELAPKTPARVIPSPLLAPKATGSVYLVFCPELRMLKIGWTKNVNQRMTQLQGQSPAELVMLKVIPATERVERDLHRAFRAKRIRGEWFEDCPEIRAEFGAG